MRPDHIVPCLERSGTKAERKGHFEPGCQIGHSSLSRRFVPSVPPGTKSPGGNGRVERKTSLRRPPLAERNGTKRMPTADRPALALDARTPDGQDG